jgi:pimeloyl-ACP methyl ester carboxylesterase
VRLIGLDQRGVDRSAPLAAGSPLTVAELVDDCEAVRLALGIGRWAVLGQSFGAMLALRYALAYPGAVSAVVFENPSGPRRQSSSVSQSYQDTMANSPRRGGDARRLRHGASSDACMLGAERGSWARSPVAAGPPQHP